MEKKKTNRNVQKRTALCGDINIKCAKNPQTKCPAQHHPHLRSTRSKYIYLFNTHAFFICDVSLPFFVVVGVFFLLSVCLFPGIC